MKKYILVFSAALLLMPFLAFAQAETATETSAGAAVESNGVTLEDLEVKDPGLLPTSNFYFFKEFFRGLQRAVTFNAVSRAELELKIVNEKAAELKKVSESNADNKGLERAVVNYKENSERLKLRLEALKETSANPNVDELLDKLADRVIKHEQLFEELKAKHEAAREKIEEAQEDLEEAAADAAERLDTAEKLKERFEKAVLNQRERNVKEIRAADVLDKLEVRIKNDEVRVKISEVRDGLIEKFDARVKSRLVAPSAVPELLQNLPITEEQRLRILEQLKERTGNAEVKIRLENIESRVKEEVKEAARDKKEEAERMVKAASELLRDLKERIDSGDYKVVPESVKSLLLRAENHIVNAKAAFERENYGEAFGQANSAASAAKNAVSQLLRSNVAPSVRPAPSARPEPSVRTETEVKTRIETRTEQKPAPAAPLPAPTNILPKTIIPELKVEIPELKVQIPAVTAVPAARKWNVEIRSGRFTPSELKIKKGDTIVWTNFDSSPSWPASAIHPTHQVYPGFDALRGLKTGESYSFTFDRVGSFRYHDHLNSSMGGVVEVTE